MKVAYDDQIFHFQTHGGISRYFSALMRAYREDPSLGVELTNRPIWTANEHLIETGLGLPVPARFQSLRRTIWLANQIRPSRNRSAVVHHTYYKALYLRRFGSRMLRVVTIHDMIPERFPEIFRNGSPHADKRAFVEAADLILCISESAKRDLLEIYGIPDAPIVVTPHGVDERFRPGLPRNQSLPERYVLFVGSRRGYKDFKILAEAFASADLAEDVWLAVVGGGRLDDEERAFIDRLGVSERVVQTQADDAHLAAAYANAICFVFPSRYEGFGLPTLEAMASGCPTILAASSAHLEVGGEAALFFPPGDPAKLSRVLGEVASDSTLRSVRSELGVEHAARFTWRETARLTAASYLEHVTGR